MQKLLVLKVVHTLPSSLPALSCVFNLLPVPLTSQGRCKLLTGRSALWPCQGASLSHPFLDQGQVTTRADRGTLHAPNHLTQPGDFQSTFSSSPLHESQAPEYYTKWAFPPESPFQPESSFVPRHSSHASRTHAFGPS